MQNILLKNIQSSNKVDFNNMLNELIMLHKKGILTDEEFAALIRAVGTNHIESEVTKRIYGEFLDKVAMSPFVETSYA